MSAARDAPAPLYPRLRPAPQGPPPETVAFHQRARLHGAMVEAVARRGYPSVTLRQLCALAGVSTRSFYQRFSSKEACLISTYELITGSAAERGEAALGGEVEPRLRLEGLFAAFAAEVAGEPKGARLALLDILDGGAEALLAARRGTVQMAALLATAIEPAADAAAQPSPLVVYGVLAGSAQLMRSRLLAGRAQELPALAAPLAEWACTQLATPHSPPPGAADLPSASAAELRSPLRLSAGEEGGGERALLLAACAQLAAGRSCAGLSPARIAKRAGVPRRAFDRHFESAEECLVAAYEQLCGGALAQALAAARCGEGWPDRVGRAMATLADRLAHDPLLARIAFGARPGVGSSLIRAETRLLADFAAALRERAPAGRPSPLAVEAGVGAAWAILGHRAARGAGGFSSGGGGGHRQLARAILAAPPDPALAPGAGGA